MGLLKQHLTCLPWTSCTFQVICGGLEAKGGPAHAHRGKPVAVDALFARRLWAILKM